MSIIRTNIFFFDTVMSADDDKVFQHQFAFRNELLDFMTEVFEAGIDLKKEWIDPTKPNERHPSLLSFFYDIKATDDKFLHQDKIDSIDESIANAEKSKSAFKNMTMPENAADKEKALDAQKEGVKKEESKIKNLRLDRGQLEKLKNLTNSKTNHKLNAQTKQKDQAEQARAERPEWYRNKLLWALPAVAVLIKTQFNM